MRDEVLTGVIARYTGEGSHVQSGKKENISKCYI